MCVLTVQWVDISQPIVEELLGGRRGGGWEAICGWQGLLNLDGFGEEYISSDSLGLFGSMKKV